MGQKTENYDEYINSICDDIMAERLHWDEDQLPEIISEHADSSQLVIYYSQAHDFVRSLSHEDLCLAEDEYRNCWGGEFISYGDAATKIAYFALYAKISEEMHNRLEKEKQADASNYVLTRGWK